MSIANRICDLLSERDIPFTVRINGHEEGFDWNIIAHHREDPDQIINAKTTLAELWWLN